MGNSILLPILCSSRKLWFRLEYTCAPPALQWPHIPGTLIDNQASLLIGEYMVSGRREDQKKYWHSSPLPLGPHHAAELASNIQALCYSLDVHAWRVVPLIGPPHGPHSSAATPAHDGQLRHILTVHRCYVCSATQSTTNAPTALQALQRHSPARLPRHICAQALAPP